MRKLFVLFFLGLGLTGLDAQTLGGDVIVPPKDIIFRTRLGLMPTLIFYKNQKEYTANTRPGQGLGLSLRGEITFKKRDRLKLMMGADYLAQKMNFDSYYNPYFYDLNFKYHHRLIIHQLVIPFLLKRSFGDEDNQINIFYIQGGWAFRALMGAHVKVTDKEQDAVEWRGFSDLSLEHNFILDGGGGSFMGGFGIEHKTSQDFRKSVFFEVQLRHHLSRVYYTGNNLSNKIKFKDTHLMFTIGKEF